MIAKMISLFTNDRISAESGVPAPLRIHSLAALLGVAAMALAIVPLHAQETDEFAPSATNRLSLSYRLGLNVRARFSHLGALPSMSNPGPAASGQSHTYDDGYVLPDGVNDGYTWNWGYRSDSQVPGNDTIQFHSGSQGDAEFQDSSDPQHGMELSYERWLGRVGKRGNWGLSAAFDYLNIGLHSTHSAYSTTLTDSYALNGVIPPQAPYDYPGSGPGPLISDTPMRSTSRSTLVTGHHDVDADLFGFRVGPYLEYPINHRLTANFSAGLALAVVSSDFRYDETVLVSGGTLGSSSGSNSRTDLLYGPYVAANLYYALNPRWSLLFGAEYQGLTNFKQTANGREAKIDFSSGVYLKAGLSFSF